MRAEWAEIPDEMTVAEIHWRADSDVPYQFRTLWGGHAWLIRINDFPEEVAFSLFRDGALVVEFDTRPERWTFG